MKRIVTYKYKLKLNKTQQAKAQHWVNVCRIVYNLALEVKIAHYQAFKNNEGNPNFEKYLNKYALNKQLKPLKKAFPWIADVSAQTLENVILRLDEAYNSFFRGGGFPRWARKDRYKSVTFRQNIKQNDNSFYLPKFGNVRVFKDRMPNGKIKQAILKQEVNGWHLSVMFEQEVDEAVKLKGNQIGIDLGVKYFATLSDGRQIENPSFLKSGATKLRILQRKLARQKKGSNRREKTKIQLAKQHKKIANQRNYFLHKLSSQLIDDSQAIAVEDLRLKNMTKSAKGDAENHGKNVKAKSGLNRVLLDLGAYSFLQMLEYKAKWRGRTFVKVDPKYTSQQCHECGHTAKENRKSQASFECVNCGHEANADVNAALNIKKRAFSPKEGDVLPAVANVGGCPKRRLRTTKQIPLQKPVNHAVA